MYLSWDAMMGDHHTAHVCMWNKGPVQDYKGSVELWILSCLLTHNFPCNLPQNKPYSIVIQACGAHIRKGGQCASPIPHSLPLVYENGSLNGDIALLCRLPMEARMPFLLILPLRWRSTPDWTKFPTSHCQFRMLKVIMKKTGQD